MVKKGGDFSEISYVLGIVSIVLAFFQPLAGFVFGVIGFIQSKKQSGGLSQRARKLNVIGIILSILFFVITMVLAAYFTTNLKSLI